MKKLTTVLILLISISICKAQKKPVNVYADAQGHPIIYGIFDPNTNIFPALAVDSNTKWIKNARQNILPNQILGGYFFLSGTKKVKLFASIPTGDFRNYRYNLIQNDSIYLATNAIPSGISKAMSEANRLEMNLGEYDVENKKLTLEIYKISQPDKISTIFIYNKELKPVTIGTSLIVYNLKRGEIMKPLQDGSSFKMQDGKETVNKIQLGTGQTEVAFIYSVYIKNISTGKTLPVPNDWYYSYRMDNYKEAFSEMRINASFFDEPGNYEITVIPQIGPKTFPDKAATFHFTVLKGDTVYSLQTIIILILTLIALGAVVFTLIFYHSKSKLQEQEKQKEAAQIQLSAVRSQLNPHFLFNALSGIQNLMNKNDADQANRYLARFARLTRNVLNSNELINVTDETELLDDYLQMEQLRFGFTYQIDIDKSADVANTEIPAMLLQPFVENAVKHGMADKGAEGKIAISIKKHGNDIELTISDNGRGFDTEKENAGLGITLSKKRIALLNKIYKNSPVLMNIKSDRQHTTVTITLTRWV